MFTFLAALEMFSFLIDFTNLLGCLINFETDYSTSSCVASSLMRIHANHCGFKMALVITPLMREKRPMPRQIKC